VGIQTRPCRRTTKISSRQIRGDSKPNKKSKINMAKNINKLDGVKSDRRTTNLHTVLGTSRCRARHAICAPARPKVVRRLKNDDVEFLIHNWNNMAKPCMRVKGEIAKQNLKSSTKDNFPPAPKFTNSNIKLNREFVEAIKQAIQCCSDDPWRKPLNGVFVGVSDKKATDIVGTDGRMLYSAKLPAIGLKNSVIIPASKAALKFLNSMEPTGVDCTLAYEPAAQVGSAGWIKLASPRLTFIAHEMVGKFPNWKSVVPKIANPKTTVKLSPSAAKQLMETLPTLPGTRNQRMAIRIKCESGQLWVEGRDENSDWKGVLIKDATVTRKPVTIGLNREYLLTALKFGLNEIHLENELDPLVCLNGGKKLIIMPIKLDASPAGVPAHTNSPDTNILSHPQPCNDRMVVPNP